MGITIAGLVAVPYLGMRLLAGQGGGEREVTWVHSSDLSNPWDWMGDGELLLTNGIGLPAGGADQVAFITRLAEANASGLGIGEGHPGPPLTPDALAAAEERAFPIMSLRYEIQFAAVAREVAAATRDEEHARLVQTARVYDAVRAAAETGSMELLERLGAELRCQLHVVDRASGRPLLGTARPPDVTTAFPDRFPALLRLEPRGVAVPVAARPPAVLLAFPTGRQTPPLALLQHVATIVALEVERQSAERERRRRLGAELFAQLIDARIDDASAVARLAEHGLEPPFVIASWPADELHEALTGPNLDTTGLALIPDDPVALERLVEAIAARPIGVSNPVPGAWRVPDAVREARWAQRAARPGTPDPVRYAQASPLFLSRTLSEAQDAVEAVLGKLIAYDTEHGTEFLRSLSVLLDCDRSRRRAAQRLHVHPQTLGYRIGRIEALTERKLGRVGDLAELWFALRAYDLLESAAAPRH